MRLFIYLSITLIFLLTISVIIFDFGFSLKQIDNIVKIVPALFAAAGLIVTLSLYDKFGLKKYIYEKKIKSVLDYIEELRKFKIKYYIIEQQSNLPIESRGYLNLSNNMSSDKKRLKKIFKYPIFIYSANVEDELSKFVTILDNIYLPKEVSKFPFHPYWHKNVHNLPQQYVIIIFGDKHKTDFQTDYLKHLNSKDVIFIEFITKFENQFKYIKKWISKNNLDEDINF